MLRTAPPIANARTAARPRAAARPARRSGRALVAPMTVDPIRVSLAALMLVSIGRVQEALPVLGLLRPGITLTAGCLLLALMTPKQVIGAQLKQSPPMKRVMLFFGLALVVAALGLGPGASIQFLLEVLLPTIVFAGLVTVAIRDVGDARIIIASYVLSLAYLNYQAMFVWEFQTFGGFQRVASTTMYDANDLGALFAAGLPLSVLFAQTSGTWGKLLGYGVALATPATVALTGSRGGFLGLLATGLGLVLSVPKVGVMKRLLMIAVPVVAVALAAPPGYMTKMGTILNPQDDYNVTDEAGRIAIWKRGLSYLAERPLTGVGASNFVRAQWAHPQQTATGAPVRAMSSHNSFIQAAVENGVPVFLVWASVLVMGTIGLRRIKRRLPASWLRESPRRRFIYLATCYLPVCFFGWSVSAFFVSHAYHVPFYILAALAGATMLLLRRELAPPVAAGAATSAPTGVR